MLSISRQTQRTLTVLAIIAAVTVLLLVAHPFKANAACAALDTSRGTDTTTISVPTAGTYVVWTRLMAPDTTNNSVFMQIDNTTCGVVVGDNAAIPAKAWTWVNYQGGNTSNKISVNLTAGPHTIVLTGRENSVAVDRLILTTDTSCTPTGTGDNCVNVDNQNPTPPSSLTATAASSTQVNLSWTASTDNVAVTAYQIIRNGAQIATIGTNTSYADKTVQPGSTYNYTVTAADGAGNTSLPSNSASVTTPQNDKTPPSVPAGLATSNLTDTSLTLTWQASTDDSGVVAGYNVYRNGNLVKTTAGTSFNDSGLSANTAYAYTVNAFDAATPTPNTSALSSPLTVTTLQSPDTTKPSIPTGVQATANTAGNPPQVSVSWQASTDNVGVTGYYVLRNNVVVATVNANALAYVDKGVVANTTYQYSVEAFDAAKNVSAPSTAVSATTPAENDPTPPTAPTNLGAAPTPGMVTLSWTASTDNVGVAGYTVSRDGTKLGTTTATSFGDATVQPNTTYNYSVTAFDAAGNQSPPATVTVTTPTNTPLPPEGPGLTGAYFANSNLTGPAIYRADAIVNFNWGTGAPFAGLPTDNFSVRWTGQITPAVSSTYTIYTNSDDGVRLWINGNLLIDDWTNHKATVNSAKISLTRGTHYNIKVEYYENQGKAVMQLSWKPAGGTQTIIPVDQLSTAANGLFATYYNTVDLTGPIALTRPEPNVNYDWGTASPDPAVNVDYFSTNWIGRVVPPAGGNYTFYTDTDDGVRLWINGQLVIDDWHNHKVTENSATVPLVGGIAYPIQMQYYENAGKAVAQLYWSGPGIPKQVIPNSALMDR